jgi:co-chaperonin GroES (HSP10)
MEIKAFGDRIIADMIDSPELMKQTQSGIYINDKDGSTDAIRPRWFKVLSVGPRVDAIEVNQYVFVDHGRWTRGINVDDTKIYRLDNKDILLVSDEDPMVV